MRLLDWEPWIIYFGGGRKEAEIEIFLDIYILQIQFFVILIEIFVKLLISENWK